MVGRKAGFRHTEETRNKIKAAQIINRLEDHVFAPEPIMDASQVNAAKALLAKVLPDLASTDNKTTIDVSDPLKSLLEDIASNGKRLR